MKRAQYKILQHHNGKYYIVRDSVGFFGKRRTKHGEREMEWDVLFFNTCYFDSVEQAKDRLRKIQNGEYAFQWAWGRSPILTEPKVVHEEDELS